jgi:hypothetical protein
MLFCANISDAKRDGSTRFASEAGIESAKKHILTQAINYNTRKESLLLRIENPLKLKEIKQEQPVNACFHYFTPCYRMYPQL